MFKKRLCPTCKTGKESIIIDCQSPVCPYADCYSNGKCTQYKKDTDLVKRKCLFAKIFNRKATL